ncbi:unnamed protein product [Spodoptera exigua]|nr:unnamed protein product [Spodoptera exigua]
METTTTSYTRSKTTNFFYKINFIIYTFGLPNFWIEDLKLTKKFVKFYDKFSMFNNTLIFLLIIFELCSYFTQTGLTEKQQSNRLIYAISHPMLFMFRVMMTSIKERVRLVMYSLTVGLKRVHNDPEVEKQMIACTVMYLSALLLSCLMSMIMYAAEGFWEVVRNGNTFTTIITAYPAVEDDSDMANLVRAICFIIWWMFLTRIFAVYILVISLTTCLSYQYKNLQSYFLSLNDIFERNDLSQIEKENQYEAGFKVGIKLHADTLSRSANEQVDYLMNSERTLVNLCSAGFTATAVLISTGFYMWNAGDVTVEAPVVLKGLGYIDLSYQSYIKIVKSSYSVFSVIF